MRYYYELTDDYVVTKGCTYQCEHPLYLACTLYTEDDLGLAVIQKRFKSSLRLFWYGPIDRCLIDDIYSQPGFHDYFLKHAGVCTDGLYPTVTVRQIMYALKMKPLRKEWWESQEKQMV